MAECSQSVNCHKRHVRWAGRAFIEPNGGKENIFLWLSYSELPTSKVHAMKCCRKPLNILLIFGLLTIALQFEAVAQDFTFAQTGQGFYWPLGIDDTQYISKGGTWLNRDSANGGGTDPRTGGNPYLPNLYHTGVDMFYNNGGSTFGAPVYATATGTVVSISGPDTPDRKHGWGPPPAVGILIRH